MRGAARGVGHVRRRPPARLKPVDMAAPGRARCRTLVSGRVTASTRKPPAGTAIPLAAPKPGVGHLVTKALRLPRGDRPQIGQAATDADPARLADVSRPGRSRSRAV